MIHHQDDWLTIHGGDNREVMRTLPDESVQCVITSPPYWGLRDYGTAAWDGGDPDCDHTQARGGHLRDSVHSTRGGANKVEESQRVPYRDRCGKCGATRQDRQLGLERTPDEYVAAMVDVFREVRRVLRRDGTLWLNLGDSYAGGNGMGRNDADRDFTGGGGNKLGSGNPGRQGTHERITGLKPKDLVGIPWRVAFALQADGWYLRSDIIWSKPNPMPESVTDRPTKAHEYLFLLAKSATYAYDADAIREPNEAPRAIGRLTPTNAPHVPDERPPRDRRVLPNESGRNRRSVWSVATKPYPGAHFATFPEALVEPCILAGTSEAGACAECGAPRRRVVEVVTNRAEAMKWKTPKGESGVLAANKVGLYNSNGQTRKRWATTTGWEPTCDHDAPSVPCVVMDPFAGTGTVGVVAQRLSRRAVLIDLNPEYLEQLMRRNQQAPLGLGVTA